ncbi:hypothetical protein AAC387_Pa04g0907 [Persea americana]
MVPPTSDNSLIVFWSLLLLTSINLTCFAQSLTPLTNETDRLALLAFKDQISDDPNQALSSWNHSVHFCMWNGVTCGRRHSQRVTALNFINQSLVGYLSPHIGNLSFLKHIDLSSNSFQGQIPEELQERISFTSFKKESFLRVTYGELLRATNGFSSANLIGVGSYSSVYKGILSQMETIVAIKVLSLQQRRAFKSFIVECKVLGSIRHRNIVRILTVCSSLDFSGNDFMALVLEYMPNGSLDSWLHSSANGDECLQLKSLSFVQMLNVAIDIACALDYLHNHCQAPIIHCDLKPSNVLLDEDMVAHVGDFGLAGILSEDFNYSQSQTNSLTVRGTIGYVAPEYGTGAITSTFGDVYSYGIVLLEMLIGKRPSDDMFENNLSLHQFAKRALPERVMEIIDHGLLSEEIEIIGHSENSNNGRSKMQEALISLVEIVHFCMWNGVTCGRRHSERVTALHFINQSLVGYLSPHIGNLSFLKDIHLSSNSFQGQIPQEDNSLDGSIPREVGKLANLRELEMAENKLYDMVAHVGDFGLARILSEDFNYSQSQTNSLTIRGTIGYVAPEYGTGAIISTSGDVYSYGIILLEMLTGKRPSDDMFENKSSLY